MNDKPNCLNKSMPAMYADDTNLFVTGTLATDVEVKLNCELELVHDWVSGK